MLLKSAWYLRSWKKDEGGKGVDAGKALDVTGLDFSKTSSMVSSSILVSTRELNGPDWQITVWVKCWVDHWVQNTVAGVYSTWVKWQVAFFRNLSWSLFDISYCCQWPVGGDNASHHIWGWHQIGGAVNPFKGRPVIQRDLDKPEKRACRNITKFSKKKWKVMHLWRRLVQPVEKDSFGGTWYLSYSTYKVRKKT